MTYKYSLTLKKDIEAKWLLSTYVPLEGEPCYDTTNGVLKIGNGVDLFVDLSAITGGAGEGGESSLSELEKVAEGVSTGWRMLGQNPANYGDIGDQALDFSFSETAGIFGATGDHSFATGFETIASGDDSFAAGYLAKATMSYAFASGNATQANAEQSHAEGHGGICDGNDGHVENHFGYIGINAHACHVEGFGATITMDLDDASTVIGGLRVIPPGGGITEFEGAHAGGMHTFALGNGAFSTGYGTIAMGDGEQKGKIALGRFNINEWDSVLEVGVGNSDANRANGLVVYDDNDYGVVTAPIADIDAALFNNRWSQESENSILITKGYADANYGGSSIINSNTPNTNTNYVDEEYLVMSFPSSATEVTIKYDIRTLTMNTDSGSSKYTFNGLFIIPTAVVNATTSYAVRTYDKLENGIGDSSNEQHVDYYSPSNWEFRIHVGVTTTNVYIYNLNRQGNDMRITSVYEVLSSAGGVTNFPDYDHAS